MLVKPELADTSEMSILDGGEEVQQLLYNGLLDVILAQVVRYPSTKVLKLFTFIKHCNRVPLDGKLGVIFGPLLVPERREY